MSEKTNDNNEEVECENPQPAQLFLDLINSEIIKDGFTWDDYERWVRKARVERRVDYDCQNLIMRQFQWAIDTGLNLYVFVIGASGSGKSLATRTLLWNLQKKLQEADFEAKDFITMTFSETKNIVSKIPPGSILHQDEVPRLSGTNSKTERDSLYNWMEQARADRPFIFFCSPTLWDLPNLHFVLHAYPTKYKADNREILTEVCCEVWIPESRLDSVIFRLCGYMFVPILADGHPFKDKYFVEKNRNLDENRKYGGTRSALGWDVDFFNEVCSDVIDILQKKFEDDALLNIKLSDIRQAIADAGVSAGSEATTTQLARAINGKLEPLQDAIRQRVDDEQLKIINREIVRIYDTFGSEITIAGVKGELRKVGVKRNYIREAVEMFASHKARQKLSGKSSENQEKSQHFVLPSGNFETDLYNKMVDVISNNKTALKLAHKIIGKRSWKERLEFFFWYYFKGYDYPRMFDELKKRWKKRGIKESDYPIKNFNSIETYMVRVRKFIKHPSIASVKAETSEEIFRQFLEGVKTVSLSDGLCWARQRAFPAGSSISNQKPDLTLLLDGSPIGFLNIKWHCSNKHDFDPTPELQFSTRLRKPFAVLLLESYKHAQPTLRLGTYSSDEALAQQNEQGLGSWERSWLSTCPDIAQAVERITTKFLTDVLLGSNETMKKSLTEKLGEDTVCTLLGELASNQISELAILS
jgi:hypothetical protein